jgi:phosphoribosylglycinamide formyltransferase-1
MEKVKNKKRIAIFCSGSGSNAEKIMQYFQAHAQIEVALLLSNRPQAYALQRAKKYNVPTVTFNKQEFYETHQVVKTLKVYQIDLVVLAGFLWLVPESLLAAFPQRIINIHPALLPKFGGKGMYGHHVHEAVKSAGETESGITIHVIDAEYDKGEVLLQASCKISPNDTAEEIAQKVLALEHQHFAPTIEKYLLLHEEYT